MFFSLLLVATMSQTTTVAIPAQKDATLIEDSGGGAANGQGPHFFVGRTSQGANAVRRGLLRFDVTRYVPAAARIEAAALTLNVSQTNAGPTQVSLHRVLFDWGEGPSSSSGGQGAPALPGDSTWMHRFHDSEYWFKPGGHFVVAASARTVVAGLGSYVWDDESLARDVRLWSRLPSRNFGWAILGDESAPTTVKRFDSRENPTLAVRPVLVVTYRLPAPRSGPPAGSLSRTAPDPACDGESDIVMGRPAGRRAGVRDTLPHPVVFGRNRTCDERLPMREATPR